MKPLDRHSLCHFVDTEIVCFHDARIARLEKIKLKEVLKKKNPYLYRAKNLTSAPELITSMMDAFLSASEEKFFGDFLEELALYVSGQICGGTKSPAEGIDIQFDRGEVRYLVAVKSGPNWGNSSQHRALRDAFGRAVRVLSQSAHALRPQPVLGICYGKTRDRNTGLYIRHTGQSFWHFLSGDPLLYIDIIEPIGYEAKKHNDDYQEKRSKLLNRFASEFIDLFCKPDFSIDWAKLVEFNSGNLRE